jgi:RecB family exonuclease
LNPEPMNNDKHLNTILYHLAKSVKIIFRMTHITYLLGQTVEARNRLLEQELHLKCIDPLNCLHITPSRAMATELEGQGPGSMNRRIDTLPSLIERIFYDDLVYQSFREFSYMDDALRELAVHLILERRNAAPEGLRYFYPLFSSSTRTEILSGVYRHILGFFSLLVNNNFEDHYVEVLSRAIFRSDELTPGSGEQRYALDTDLALLFGDYEEFKRSNHLYDNDDISSNVRSFLAEGNIPGILKDTDVLVLNGFTSITRAEETILLSLFEHADEVIWPLDCDPVPDDPITAIIGETAGKGDTERYEAFRIFSSIGSMLKKIEEARYPTAVKRATPEEFKNPFASGFYRSGIYDSRGEQAIHVKAFNTRLDEVRGIAGEIKRIWKEKAKEGVPQVRVIFPDLAQYSSLIYEIFPAYGIPFNITKGLPLCSSPLARLFLLMFDIPLNDFRRQDIRAFFTSGLVSPAASTMDNEDKPRWLRLLEGHGAFFDGEKKDDSRIFPDTPLEKTLHKGTHGWIETVDVVAGQCGIQGGAIVPGWLSQARDCFLSRYRLISNDKKASLLAEYHHFLHHLFYVHENVKPFEDLLRTSDPGAFVQALFRLLNLFGVQEKILLLLDDKTGLDRKELERIIRRDIKTLDTLKDLAVTTARELEKAEFFMPSPGHSSLLERFRNGFAVLVSRSRIRKTFLRGAVDISDWADIIGFSPDYVFAGGLCSEEFPLKQPDDSIMPETSVPYLRRTDLTDQSRYLFTHLLRNYRRDLYLSYPKKITDKEAQPSPVLLDMISMMDKEEPSPSQGTEALERSFPWEQNPYFTSSEDLLNAIQVEYKIAIPSKQGSFSHGHIILGTDRLLNESIIRGVGCLLARNCTDGLTEYDGLISGSPAFRGYRFHPRGPLSPSRLDTIANCPMRYLFQAIYRLEPIEELEQELSPRDLGSCVHAILRLIFEEVKKRGENIASIGLPRAFALAREISTDYFSQLAYLERLDLFEAQKRDILDGLETESVLTHDGLPKRQGLIAQLLRFEAHYLKSQKVQDLEYGFGDDDAHPVRMGKMPLRGSIDRVDKLDEKEEVYLIYDYKTGTAPGPSAVKKGLSFQLPGYIAAIAQERDAKAVAARYYLINRKHLAENNPLSTSIGSNLTQKAGIDLTGVTLMGEFVSSLMDLLDRGIFHHSTDELMCSFCEFRYACYKNMRRMSHLIDSGNSPELYSGRKNLERWKEVEGFQRSWKEIRGKMAEPLEAMKEEKRRKNLEQVLEFKRWLAEKRHSLPLDQGYVDEIAACLGEYQDSSKD